MSAKPFLDTNILVYAFATGDRRTAVALKLLYDGGIVSVQVLNEFVNVSRRKLHFQWAEVESALHAVQTMLDPPIPLTVDLHESAVSLARDHRLAFYDALIIAAASRADCTLLLTEDMQHGRRIGVLTIRNPFLVA